VPRALVLAWLSFVACEGNRPAPVPTPRPTPAPKPAPVVPSSSADAGSAAAPPGPVRVESVTVGAGRSVFVLRGARGGKAGVFLHGLCGAPQFYLEAFANAAADYGPFIAPNGDAACNGAYRSWSGKLAPLETQIEEGLRAAGVSGPLQGVLLVGYSMGGTRALSLAQRAPERFTRLILIGTPETPSPKGLEHLLGAVMMAGSRDRQDKMKAGARAFERAGISSTFMALPGAAHGEMGSDAERVMGEAFHWLEANSR
jgi:pimeloyl-ACP methyl ester carboxylesterase